MADILKATQLSTLVTDLWQWATLGLGGDMSHHGSLWHEASISSFIGSPQAHTDEHAYTTHIPHT